MPKILWLSQKKRNGIESDCLEAQNLVIWRMVDVIGVGSHLLKDVLSP
jgi:hypothetical protein